MNKTLSYFYVDSSILKEVNTGISSVQRRSSKLKKRRPFFESTMQGFEMTLNEVVKEK